MSRNLLPSVTSKQRQSGIPLSIEAELLTRERDTITLVTFKQSDYTIRLETHLIGIPPTGFLDVLDKRDGDYSERKDLYDMYWEECMSLVRRSDAESRKRSGSFLDRHLFLRYILAGKIGPKLGFTNQYGFKIDRDCPTVTSATLSSAGNIFWFDVM